jgi:hypothetical protein
VDHGDCDAANNGLAATFSGGLIVNGNNGWINRQGSAVAFVLNMESRAEAIGSDIVHRGSDAVTASCGWYIAGTWQVDGYPHVDYGYMNYFDGINVWHDAESSGSHSCRRKEAARSE